MRATVAWLVLCWLLPTALALVSERCLVFPPAHSHQHHLHPYSLAQTAVAWAASLLPSSYSSAAADPNAPFVFATTHHALPILVSSHDAEAVHLAVQSFAADIRKTTGSAPRIYNDTLPKGTGRAVVVSSIDSGLAKGREGWEWTEKMRGRWEVWDARVVRGKKVGIEGLNEALVLTGSDRRGTIYALYTLSEQMGVSPLHFWADVPTTPHPVLAFDPSQPCAHGEPAVKYRGLFINDELPALWNWAHETYGIPWGQRPFQVGMYERVFELLLRLRANYHWPAMWASSFAVDGIHPTHLAAPPDPIPGPNQLLADRMGIVMGTSHHEPMSRNKQEWDDGGTGAWDWTNRDVLEPWWEYGAERAKGLETVFTMGMRGDGDGPLTGASKELLEGIVDTQRGILSKVYNESDSTDIPQMWCMYKEVQGYFQDGMKVPDDVTIMLADDNWGNVMAVPPEEIRGRKGGSGLYYHGEYVGRPRDYKWINTISLAKMWQQLNLAYNSDIQQIWILNVGDIKLLEIPLDYFTSLAYDFERWGVRNSLDAWMRAWAERQFGPDVRDEVAEVLATYSQYVSRIKPELLNTTLFSLENYDEAELRLAEWSALETKSTAVYQSLDTPHANAYFELLHSVVLLMANLNRLYVAVGKNNLYADQARSSTNLWAKRAVQYFERDRELTREYHELYDGRWNHMLTQTHINYNWWAERQRDIMPPVSYIETYLPARPSREGRPPGLPAYVRYTLENSRGAWPGVDPDNCDNGWECWTPTWLKMDPYGAGRRWVEVSSGGPKDTRWKVSANESWVVFDKTEGEIKADGSTDERVWVSVDWDKVETGPGGWFNGSAEVEFSDNHGMNQTIIFPIVKPPAPPRAYVGFVEGDGYVVMEAAHHSGNTSKDGYAWQEVEGYGRTLSGLEVLPVNTAQNFSVGEGPVLEYEFYSTGASAYTARKGDGRVKVTVQLGPTFNYVLGHKLALGLQMDGQTPQIHTPVPDSAVSAEQGTTPLDWWNVVSSEVRNVTATFDLGAGDGGVKRGRHTLRIWGMTGGMVVTRVWVDFGGIKQRGYSYLGPPESRRL